jgi:DNA-binding winged helix-turn-helix (wHTH) protein
VVENSTVSVRWDLYELDVPGRRLHGPEGDVHLEPQVFDVLAYLVEHRERVIEKSELLDQVWGDQFVSESALTTRIKQVRRAVGDDGRTQRFIRKGSSTIAGCSCTDRCRPSI